MKAFLQAIGRVMYRLVMPLRRRRLKNRIVSIVSNDCWSSFMYRFYGLPFNSPFVGLFIMPDHYLAMLENPEVLATPPRMTSSAESVYAGRLSDLPPYPLGILPGGIEIHFLHYATAEEALDKWTRRMSRLDWDNCIVKFSRNNGCTDGHLRRFDALPFPHKVAFSTAPLPGVRSVVAVPEFAGDDQLGRYWKLADLHYDFGRHADAIRQSER